MNHDGAYDLRGRLQLHFGRPNFLTGEDDGHPIVLSGFNLAQNSRALVGGELHPTARDRALAK